ncbi:MAG: hypothetical protein P4L84_08950 [Isosphaeraceae bacterium]|nr:hypothetical protein [Isosphaeraceae bacterium]
MFRTALLSLALILSLSSAGHAQMHGSGRGSRHRGVNGFGGLGIVGGAPFGYGYGGYGYGSYGYGGYPGYDASFYPAYGYYPVYGYYPQTNNSLGSLMGSIQGATSRSGGW